MSDKRPTPPASRGLQERVAVMMERGVSLDQVENEVIDHSPLNQDQKAALWLYAWSFRDDTTQRREATQHVDSLEPV
jgi:rhamnogalacturonyl hydrolase YesR